MKKENEENKGINWGNIFILLIAIGIGGVVICFYRNIFTGDFSTNPNDWNAFGAYFGGVMSPIFTFLMLFVVIKNHEEQKKLINKQIKKMQDQIDDNRKEINKKELELTIRLSYELVETLNNEVGKIIAEFDAMVKIYPLIKTEKSQLDTWGCKDKNLELKILSLKNKVTYLLASIESLGNIENFKKTSGSSYVILFGEFYDKILQYTFPDIENDCYKIYEDLRQVQK